MITFATFILNDDSIQPRGELIRYKQFHNMDRVVQLRPGYGVGLSMFSNRIGNFESINSENQKAYHTADGMLYLYNDDLYNIAMIFGQRLIYIACLAQPLLKIQLFRQTSLIA